MNYVKKIFKLFKIRNLFIWIYKKIKKISILIIKKIWRLKKFFYIIPFALLVSISQNISSRSQLEFSFSGMIGNQVDKQFYQLRHVGLIKNKSKEKNTITNIGLVVWENDSKTRTLRDGFGPMWMIDNKTGKEIKLPLVIEGREAINIDIFNKFFIKGTADEKLLTTRKPVMSGSSSYLIPRDDYQLTFIDINDNEFSEDGKLINRDVVDMNWTLENYCGDTYYNRSWLCQKQRIKIVDCKIMFKIKMLFHWLGMESIGNLIYRMLTNFEK